MVEFVLIENFFINLIVLKTSALLLKEKGKFYLLSAFLCGCLAVAIDTLKPSNIGQFISNVGMAVIAICITFKFKKFKKFCVICGCYLLSNLLYGGVCFFIDGFFGIKNTLVLLLFVILIYFVVKFVIKRFSKKRAIDNFCFDIEITSGTKSGKWRAFLDSGNFLNDPVTDSPVNLVNFKVFSKLFGVDEKQLLSKEHLQKLKCAHYINLNTLSGKDKILVFQVDKIVAKGKIFENATLGLCLKHFNYAFNADVILNNCFA